MLSSIYIIFLSLNKCPIVIPSELDSTIISEAVNLNIIKGGMNLRGSKEVTWMSEHSLELFDRFHGSSMPSFISLLQNYSSVHGL